MMQNDLKTATQKFSQDRDISKLMQLIDGGLADQWEEVLQKVQVFRWVVEFGGVWWIVLWRKVRL